MLLACSAHLLAQADWHEVLPLVRAQGLAAVELAGDWPQQPALARLLSEHSLQVALVDLGRLSEVEADDAQLAERVRQAAAWQAPVALLDAGAAETDAVRTERYRRLRRLADVAGEAGITLALDTQPGMCRTSRGMLRTVEELAHPALRLQFDTAGYLDLNPGTNGEIALQRVCPWLASLRLADHTGEPDNREHPPLGQGGAVDFSRTLEIVRAIAFDGPVVVDVRHRRPARVPLERLHSDLADSVDQLRRCGWFD